MRWLSKKAGCIAVIAMTGFVIACGLGEPSSGRASGAVEPNKMTGRAGGKSISTTEYLDRGEGAELFNKWCVPCHGKGGQGDGITASRLDPPPKDLSSKATCDFGRAKVEEVIARGARRLGRKGVMPPFGETLAPFQIPALAAHLHTFCRVPDRSAKTGSVPRSK